MERFSPTRFRVFLVLVACVALACESPNPTASASPTGMPTATLPGESSSATGWIPALLPTTIEEPLPQVYGGSMASAVVAFKGSLLAFGGINGGCCDASFSTDTRAVVWTSADGHAWKLQERHPELALGRVTAATASAERVVVIGERLLEAQVEAGSIDRQGAVWTSGDGESWELVSGVPIFATIAATPTGFVAASNAHLFPELWWSETGGAWERIAGGAELGQGRIDRLLATPIGVFGVGASLNPEGDGQPEVLDPPAAVWHAVDGRAWVRAPAGAMFSGASMRDVAWSDGRLLAIGSGGMPIRPAFWTSLDGDAWDRVEGPALAGEMDATDAPGVTDIQATHVIGLEHGFAVSGTWVTEGENAPESGLVVWATQDGHVWEQVTTAGPVPEINGWQAIPGGGIAVVGWGPVGGQQVPLAWTIATSP